MPMKNNSSNIQQIGQIAIAVSDIDKSVAFYRDILDLELLFEIPPGLAFLDCGGIRLMLTVLQGDPEDHHTSTIYYKVVDVRDTQEELEQKGVTFIQDAKLVATMPDHELWMGFIRDPDKNLIGIMAELPLSPA
jgi:catechol 2,3-dioxygenase-like lactoylglutathione lyase family enzyme